ncbi:hypothetical protein F4780DRAFT_751727 [Xylariomycetidae sp. FL0641]|nr:hypothetical protein F4780DRAFT_751727 [Xylariomycetidae sp. FL0641]
MSHVNSERPPSSRAGERSNIPTMRRERRKNSDAARNALREAQSRERLKPLRPHGSDVRWDPRTGEPTTGPKGKPSQINPQEYVQGIGSQAKPLAPPLPNQAPSEVSWVERARRLQQANANPRPEWKGASGRENFVAPVNDNKDAPPLKPPPRDGRRAARGPAVSTPDDATKPETSLAAPGAQGRSDSAEPTSARQVRGAVPPPQSYPSPPLSDDNSGPAKRAIPTTTSAQPSHKSLRPLQIPSTEKAIRRKPAGAAAHRPDNATPSPAQTPQHDLHPSQVPPGAFPSEWTQPPSRFSVTTAATSNPASTPRQSLGNDVPSLPTPPPQEQVSPKPAPGSSILDRRRPVVSGFEASPRQSPTTETVKISMDSPYYTPTSSSTMTKTRTTGPRPVAGGASAMGRHANTSTLSVDSTATTGTDKMLPPAPPEVEGAAAQDRVAQLNARLTALAQRRQNLHTAIRQMTELMPADNLLAAEAVVRKREAEKRKVENLRAELADVENDSYQLGLKLHRAYKRLDRDAEYEPTTLWVRRVTG